MDIKSASFHLIIRNTLCFLLPVSAIVGSIHTRNDQEALLAFKEKVVLDPFGSLGSWNSSVPLCQWYGVTCGHRHQTRVVMLNLRHESLTGSYGSVFKGTLDDHFVVAIKVLNMSVHGASTSFMAECDVLRNIRHRNLVKVLTTCSGVDYQGDEFKALIYEFMVNGNLDEWLHQNPDENNSITKRLSFSRRLNIAIDVAHALDYLHNGCETSIVHCDLKPSNILLDNECVAHVGDFGLASTLPSEIKSSIKGSIGYTAPEYGTGSKPSIHGDVYSFGILLLEMFTGKRPTNDMFRDLMDLHYYVKNALPDEVIEIVDPRIIEDWDRNDRRANTQENVRFSREAHKQVKGLIAIFRLGVACSSYSITERENMKGVVQKLCSIRDVYTANS